MQTDEEKIKEINQKILQGEWLTDKNTLDPLLSDNLIFRRADGTEVTKAQYLADLSLLDYELLQLTHEEITSITENSAEAEVYIAAKGSKDKKEFGGIFKNLRKYKKENGIWKLHHWYNTKVSPVVYALKSDQYVDLWMYFENKAETIKERMWTIFSFHSAILLALLAFMFKRHLENADTTKYDFYLAILGIGYGIYSLLQLIDLKRHIGRNQDRGTQVMRSIEGLKKLIDPNVKKTGLLKKIRKTIANPIHASITLCCIIIIAFIILLSLNPS